MKIDITMGELLSALKESINDWEVLDLELPADAETIFSIYDDLGDAEKARVREMVLESLTTAESDAFLHDYPISDLLDILDSKINSDSPYEMYRFRQMFEARDLGRTLIAQLTKAGKP